MRVVVTRELGHNETLKSWLPEGASVSEVPLTTTRYLDAQEVLSNLRASENYGAFGSLVVTSARTALYVALAREALAKGGSVLSVGTETARALENEDVEVDVVGESGAIDLAPHITAGPVLILGAATMRDALPTALGEHGITVETLTCYETLPAVLSPEDEAALGAADVVFIGAPSAWLVASAHVSDASWVVVPGTTTRDAVKKSHERVLVGWGANLRELLPALY